MVVKLKDLQLRRERKEERREKEGGKEKATVRNY